MYDRVGLSMMWKLRIVMTLLVTTLFAQTAGGQEVVIEEPEMEMIHVMVGFEDESSQSDFQSRLQSSNARSSSGGSGSSEAAKVRHKFKRTKAVAMTIPAIQWAEIEADPSVAYIEEDGISYQFTETVPWGINTVQGNDTSVPPAMIMSSNSDCFKICVIDSGLFVGHSDIPYTLGTNIDGKEFNLEKDLTWYNPSARSNHGTHVTVR
jgi:hypothetical protein